MTLSTLVLTPGFIPHQTACWQEAITLVFLEKAQVLENYEATVSSPSVTLQVPAVIRLTKHLVHHKSEPKFSRINVYSRDGFRCQYCGKKHTMKELNYDHVVPRSKGGLTNWTNIVTSCHKCNLQKDCKTLEQSGFKLLKKPVKPKSLPVSGVFVTPRNVPEVWKPYLNVGILEAAG